MSLKEAQSYYKELKRNFTTNLPSGDELQEKQESKELLEQELQDLKSNSADLENQIKTLNERSWRLVVSSCAFSSQRLTAYLARLK